MHLSEENKFCRIRKTQNGIPTLLEENIENCSEFIKNDTWISIIIQMKNDKTKIFFIKNEILIQIFEIISDSTNENNKVALLSYGTMAGFTEFELMPSEDYDFSLNNQIHSQFEINKEKNSIFLNSCSQISTKEREKYCRKTFQEHHKFLLCKVN